MNKQEFINKILEVGNGNSIDVAAIDPCEKYNQWCVRSLDDFIKWDERIDSQLGRAIFIDNYQEANPPTQVSDIRFFSEGGTQVDELDDTWLTERINELPFITPTPTPAPAPSCITCDADTCSNSLGIKSGCELLLHYDVDKDGTISYSDAMDALEDYYDGVITHEEADFAIKCHEDYDGSIDAMCPGCTEATPTPTPTQGYFLSWIIEPLASLLELLTGDHEKAVTWAKGIVYFGLAVLVLVVGLKIYRWIRPKE